MEAKVSVSSSEHVGYTAALAQSLRDLFVDWGYPDERAKKAAIRAVFGESIVSELESDSHESSG